MIGSVVAVASGMLAWTFLEYVIHRWGGHDRRFRRTPFGVEHIRHHIEGNYFSPSWKKLIAAAIAAVVVGTPAVLIAGTTLGVAFTAGLVVCYGSYELIHRLDHVVPGVGPYGRWARRHHFHHHFVDGRTNHGVTSPLWDVVFGTYQTPTVIEVPPKLAMVWLLDPATGDVRPEHAGTYRLRTKGA
jgi:sterol desaturase/sphingolipid hydroxylase (fatty acid hydroxylase superfamily)